jgi:hypothetical protein
MTEALIKFIQKNWHTVLGLLSAGSLIALISFELVRHLGLPWYIALGGGTIGFVITAWYWHRGRSIPKNPRGRFGFMVAVCCSDEKQQAKVREDFVQQLRALIKEGSAVSTFNFVEVPDRVAPRLLELDELERARRKANAHFAIVGRVRLRDFDGKPHHVIDIRGLVAHKGLDKAVHETFQKEFSELLPQRIQFPQDSDLLSFEFTAELADIVARYIIGLAAALSGDLDYAERMYTSVSEKLSRTKQKFLVLEKIRTRLPFRFFEINEARAKHAYDLWRAAKTDENVATLGAHLAKIPDEPYAGRVLPLRAIHAVVGRRDIARARQIMIQFNAPENAVWHFNLAFLDAYDGQMRRAIDHYRNGSRAVIEEARLADIEEFINWALEANPDKYQFHYCLGFFNWKVRGDLRLAKRYFMNFLSQARASEFQGEQRLARKWLTEIERDLKDSSL